MALNLRFAGARHAVPAGLMVLMLFAAPAWAAHNATQRRIDALLDALIAAEPLDRAAVERLVHVRLIPASSDNGPFTFYTASNVPLGDATIALVDFRAPVAGSGAAKGSFLELTLRNGCFAESLRLRVPMRMPDGMGPNATDGGDTGWYRSYTMAWGTESFEFLYASPDCASSVVLNVTDMPRRR